MTALGTLKQYFGYDEFRSGQETLIDGIMAGRDVLGIMPTGAGKSVCFQVPALMMDGVTLIVSPLISLMKDQVNALTQSGVAAAFINSSLTSRQFDKALRNAFDGAYKLIYVAPERLPTPEMMSLTRAVKISMLTVDEAHCISQWGQDFRPSYAKIPEFIAELPSRPVVSAFTATATPRVREDIVTLLGLDDPQVLVTGFDRKNLYFDVQRPRDKYAALAAFLKDKKERSGIIYCGTRKTVEEVCGKLQADGCNASRYHAGLSDYERRCNQDEFLFDRVQIMVATNAFGMGIDKSNVSFVVHYNMPKDIESYYQEAGRAGRDGSPADCVLLYNGQDVRINQYLITHGDEEEADYTPQAQAMQAHNLELLKQMTFYAAGHDCLRRRLLSYFGEKAPANCGNCSNCLTQFAETDVTVEAQKIASCVYRLKQRGRNFGKTMIIDILRGSKNEKIRRFGFDTLSTWNIMPDIDAHRIRLILDHLIDDGILLLEEGEYPIVTLGRAEGLLKNETRVLMKLPMESKKPADEKATSLSIQNAKRSGQYTYFINNLVYFFKPFCS